MLRKCCHSLCHVFIVTRATLANRESLIRKKCVKNDAINGTVATPSAWQDVTMADTEQYAAQDDFWMNYRRFRVPYELMSHGVTIIPYRRVPQTEEDPVNGIE
ncbi:hypothetical protein [Shewanella sp. YIC-542]|uniref:hypothetical protein n=1 Tax=Shewanella mytili TaxID=3377111 RepID=UPI00398EFA98